MTITSTTSDGIVGDASQNWSITNNGAIAGQTGGIRFSSLTANGAIVDNFGSIVNLGSAFNGANAGIVAFNGGNVVNEHGGTISSQSDGIYARIAGTLVTNSGLIQSNLTAAYFDAGGTFTQTQSGTLQGITGPGRSDTYGVIGNSGTLMGTNAGTINAIGNGYALWYRGGSGSFTNTDSGVLSGAIGAFIQINNTTLTNTGTITGTAGTAISMTGNNNVLTLGDGSILNGDAVSTGSGNTLHLEGSSTEDSNLTGFSSFTMAGADWNLGGTVTTNGGGTQATVVQSGTLILTGTLSNNNGGGTAISGGTLQLGNGGTTGSLTGNVINNGDLIFNRSNALTFGGAISGIGEVDQIGTGTTTLTGNSTYTGATYITAGVLQVSGGGKVNGTSFVSLDTGSLTVTGAGSSFTTPGDLVLGRGTGAADATVAGGGHLATGRSFIGETGSATTATALTASVTGPGSVWDSTNGFFLGTSTGSASAFLTVSNGGVMRSDELSSVVGFNGIGSATVTDTNSQLVVDGGESLIIGYGARGAGTLTITNSGSVVASSVVMGEFDAGASGALNIEGIPGAQGVLQTTILAKDVGSATVIFNGGILRADGDSTEFITGFNPGDITIGAGGAFIDSNNFAVTASSALTGPGALTKQGDGRLTLTGTNSYTGGTAISAGTLQLGDGGTTGSIVGNVLDSGTLVFNRSDALTFAGVISGTGAVNQNGTGATVLTAANSYTGTTTVNTGSLYINGDQTAATGLMTVNCGATLGGSGIIGGNVIVADGATLAPGNSPGTLTINGNLTLSSGAILKYEFGQANTVGGLLNDLTNVGGNLTLDGTLIVTTSAGGTFGPGVYRLINYSGTLTDNGLNLGTMPAGSTVFVQTSVPNQVNLVNTQSLTLNYWDGNAGPKNDNAVNGGSGTWHVVGSDDNWTDMNGVVNAPYSNGAFAIFAGTPDTVTVDNSLGAVSASGMQFAVNGYMVQGGAITLVGTQTTIRVGDGTPAGAGYIATVASELTGTGGLLKTDLGSLVLTGANTYTGGTTVSSGTLQLGDGGTSGSIKGDVTIDGTLAFNRSDMVIFGGAISGGGVVQQIGPGTTVLTGSNAAFTGRTQVRAGTFEVDGVLGGSADVLLSGRLTGTGRIGSTTNHGVIAPGSGGLGTLTVVGDYAGQGGGLEIETKLGGDNSPTDRLVVTGTTSGATPVKVTNTGGLGARTQNGILVVQVAGASIGRFTLANRDYTVGGQAAVVAGAYGYVLQKDPTDGDWYLHSSLISAGGQHQGQSDTPLYQPGVPVYEAYANTLLSLSGLGTLRERVGNRQWNSDDPDQNGVWGRVEGNSSHLEPTVSTTGAHEKINSWKALFGVDRLLSGMEDGARLVGGPIAYVGTATTQVSSGYGGGDIDTRAFGVGATLTGYGKGGGYVDVQAQAAWFNSDVSSNMVGREGNHDGYGYGFSVESGLPIPVESDFALTPQAQLSYVSTGLIGFNDRFGAQVETDEGNSLLWRLGLALDHQRSWQNTAGQSRQLNLYGLVNFKHEFLDGTGVLVSGTPVGSHEGRNWGGMGASGNYTWRGGRYSIYGEVTADTDLSKFGDSYTVAATAGFRMSF